MLMGIACRKYFYVIVLIGFCSCNNQPPALFEQLDSLATGVIFQNENQDTDTLNILDYLYYYNGGGVAAGDINNDGLTDLYFVSNTGDNKLYLNKGNWKFHRHKWSCCF